MYKSCCSGTNIKNLNSWLFQIANNVAIDIIKKENREKKDHLPSASSDDQNKWGGITEVMEPLISLLPEKYALPLKMADIDGIPQSDIADQLGLGLSATKSRIQRARKMLKEQIISCFHLELDKNGIPISANLKDNCLSIRELKNK